VTPLPPAIGVLVDELGIEALLELERACRAALGPSSTARDRRLEELGFLAALLRARQSAEPKTRPSTRTIKRRGRAPLVLQVESRELVPRESYDALRPAEVPSARALVRNYGSWVGACRAAEGLHLDGRYAGGSKPWRTPRPPAGGFVRYAREEVRDAIRACARALHRAPSSADYKHWSGARRRFEQARGADPRIPSIDVVYKHWPGWREALAAAAITPDLLGASVDGIELGTSSEAPTLRINREAFLRLRKARKVPQSAICDALDLTDGEYRRMLTGSALVTPSQVAALALIVEAGAAQIAAEPLEDVG
jgi:hypothetical protein